MALIELQSVSLKYPVVNARSHSLRTAVSSLFWGGSNASGVITYVNALNEVTFKADEGDRIGIIGGNGSGKTTLLRVLSGVYPPTKGTIKVIGNTQALTDFTLGMDQNATGRQNIYFRLAFMGYSKKRSHEFIQEIIEFSGLGDAIDRPVYTYSTGMFLRLAFSISTQFDPEILIMDEVIGTGDEEFRNRAASRIDKLISGANILVLSSHSIGNLKKFCNRILVIDNGAILFDGDMAEGIRFYRAFMRAS